MSGGMEPLFGGVSCREAAASMGTEFRAAVKGQDWRLGAGLASGLASVRSLVWLSLCAGCFRHLIPCW